MNEDYRSCMKENMGNGKLKGLTKEERKLEFCVIAKKCSKNLPDAEARRICSEATSVIKLPKWVLEANKSNKVTFDCNKRSEIQRDASQIVKDRINSFQAELAIPSVALIVGNIFNCNTDSAVLNKTNDMAKQFYAMTKQQTSLDEIKEFEILLTEISKL